MFIHQRAWVVGLMSLSLFGVMGTATVAAVSTAGEQFAALLDAKGIPHWLDVWGSGCDHHWYWWKQMAQKYFL